jgi:hypothetical protein
MGDVIPTARDAHKIFTTLKLAALDAAIIDARLTHLDFRLFYYLASASDWKTRVARRKQQVIAEALSVTRRAVQLSAGRLAALEYISVLVKEGGSYTHGYEIEVGKANASSGFQNPKANANSPLDRKRRTCTAKKANGDAEKGEPAFAPILPLYSLDIPLARPMPDVVVARLRKRVGDGVYRSWFAKITVAGVADGTVTLMAPSPFHATRIINEYEMPLLDAWRAIDPYIERVVAIALTPSNART